MIHEIRHDIQLPLLIVFSKVNLPSIRHDIQLPILIVISEVNIPS